MKTRNLLDRRDWLKAIGLGTAGGVSATWGMPALAAATTAATTAQPGSARLEITRVRAIPTCPQQTRLVVVKVETSEPGLYGLGCATFNQRPLPVITAVNEYLDPFCRGRDANNIEDLWQTAYTSSYWRNGPVLNNALSGLDMALWDIKGKQAGLPVYQLLGGKCRFAVDCYGHASGRDLDQLEESVHRLVERKYRHVRIQLGGYGSPHLSDAADFRAEGFGSAGDELMEAEPYVRSVPAMFERIRDKFGPQLELLHDVHERIHPLDALRLLKSVEPYRPFFIEDPVAPEDIGYFKLLRQQTSVPLAMGELFNNPHEWVGLITDRLIDFIRVHLSQIGGLTPARKLAILGEWFNVRTAWHGPMDVSPVGHAANAHLDLASSNFGIQESVNFNQAMQDVFPGAPVMKDGYLWVNEAPGLGVDLDEALALKFPFPERPGYWEPVRRRDGTSVRP